MFNPKTSNKKEKSLVEIMIIVIVVAVLMMSFIYYFFKEENKLTKVAFGQLAQNFSTKVTAVHAQWFMDKQPDSVILVLPNEKQHINLNSNGWIDTLNHDNSCAEIWKKILMGPMYFMNSPVSAVEIRTANITIGHVCQFELPSGLYFEYNAENGKVSQVLSRNVKP